MKKSDLKTGMWVEYRSGEKRMVALNTPYGDVLVTTNSGHTKLLDFTENLTHQDFKNMDIVAVYQSRAYKDILQEYKAEKIWQREETIEMTIEEACKKLREVTGKPIKITI